MVSSPIILSFATVFSLLGLAMVIGAVITDYWSEVQVNRREIINAFKREPETALRLQQAFGRNIIYFSRNAGIFNLCFPDTVPQEIGSFNKFGSPCIWQHEFNIPEAKRESLQGNELVRHYCAKAVIGFFVLGISFVVVSFCSGLFGCWNRSPKLIMTTAILLMLAGLFMSLAMIMWHYVIYLERHTLDVEPYYKSWEPVLRLTSHSSFGLSYFVSWIGIAFTLMASFCMFFAYLAVKKEGEKMLAAKHGAYLMPNYYDKGTGALVPYSYNTYGGYGTHPYYNNYNAGAYYGYMTYGR